MAYSGDWLEGYGLAPDDSEPLNPLRSNLLPVGCSESLVSVELAMALLWASRDLPYRSDAPLEIPRGRSISWLRRALLESANVEHYSKWIAAAEPCESPIEVVGFLALCSSLSSAGFPIEVTPAGKIPPLPELADRMTLTQITLQEPAEEYRIDISVHFNCRLGKHIYSLDVAIECDGDEYHSQPPQLIHDGIKTQVLESLGFCPVRFSGATIWSRAPECSEWIISGLRSFCGDLIHGRLPKPAKRRELVAGRQRMPNKDSVSRI